MHINILLQTFVWFLIRLYYYLLVDDFLSSLVIHKVISLVSPLLFLLNIYSIPFLLLLFLSSNFLPHAGVCVSFLIILIPLYILYTNGYIPAMHKQCLYRIYIYSFICHTTLKTSALMKPSTCSHL